MKRIGILVLVCVLPLILAGCPKKISPTVLVLYGGAVSETHSYFLNTVALLNGQKIVNVTGRIDTEIKYSSGDNGYYGAIVITDYNAYKNLDEVKKQALDDYCREFEVGLLFGYVGSGYTLNDGQVVASAGHTLTGQRVEPASGLLSLTRDGGTVPGNLPWYGRTLQVISGEGYQPVALVDDGADGEVPNILADLGDFDGVKRVFYGHDLHRFWLHDLLLLDAVQWLSPVDLGILTERWIGVDIDDIFQVNWDPTPENRTVKIQAEDVWAMIETQDALSDVMEGRFRFHLGFNCGWYEVAYAPPPYDDAAGDREMVIERDEFLWFDHLPYHQNSTDYNQEELTGFMQESYAWAEQNQILPYTTRFDLSPYHSGIYPQHDPLYNSWTEVWDVRYTSTTTTAVGFEHLGVLVAPRQSCGIWSSQYSFEQVPQANIDNSIAGGALFRTILEHPVSLFMTHQSNYARDLLGLYLFENLVYFFDQWTNFRLLTGPNDEGVERYFWLEGSKSGPTTDLTATRNDGE